MKSQIIAELTEFVKNQILKQPQRHLTPDEKIISSGLIDSFSLVDLALHIEEVYNVRIDDTELNSNIFDSIEELTQIIDKRMI